MSTVITRRVASELKRFKQQVMYGNYLEQHNI